MTYLMVRSKFPRRSERGSRSIIDYLSLFMITLLCTLIIGGHAIRSELPLYLAIFASDNHESQIEMRLSVLSAVNELLRSYPEDENLIILKSDLLQGN